MTIGYLYNVQKSQDRRQQNLPYFGDRRSGIDRRQAQRIELNQKLKQDIVNTRKLLNEYTPDVFVKSEPPKKISFTDAKIEKTAEVGAMSASDKINAYVSNIEKSETQKHSKKDDLIVEASISALGAGLGVVFPLMFGIANPVALAGASVVGLVVGAILGSKAIDYYNGIGPQ